MTRDPGTGKFIAAEPHLFFLHMKKEGAFKKFFERSLARAIEQSRRNWENPHALFFNSVFSVRRAQLPALKQRLREVLLDFVDSEECADGDDVVTLVSSLFSEKT